LENRDTDFRKSDVSVVIDNLNSMSISDFKKIAKQKRKETNEKIINSDNKETISEDALGLTEVMSTPLSDNTNDDN
ncbi:hypothetical protein WN55_08257, partial [Dufourea novaeangliae]